MRSQIENCSATARAPSLLCSIVVSVSSYCRHPNAINRFWIVERVSHTSAALDAASQWL